MIGCPASIGFLSGMVRSRSFSWLVISRAEPYRSGIFWERTRYGAMTRQSKSFGRGWTLEAECLLARIFDTQREGESVTDFVRHLERTFHVAYGQDRMSIETKEAILFG